jgi:DNA-binding NarL/FixJ family response regulator
VREGGRFHGQGQKNVLKPLVALRVMLADDNGPVRRSLKGLLEREGFMVVGEAADGREAVSLADKHRPDVVLLDLSMPHLNGIEAARQIQRLLPEARTIILTVHRDYHYVSEALEAGVRGYILKSRAVEELAKGVHQVAEGKYFFGRGLPQKIQETFQTM